MKQWMWDNQSWLTPILGFVRDHVLLTFAIVLAVVTVVPILFFAFGCLTDYISAKLHGGQAE